MTGFEIFVLGGVILSGITLVLAGIVLWRMKHGLM